MLEAITSKVTGPKTTERWGLDKSMCYIGTVAGIRFFEHPVQGDEGPLVAFDIERKRWVITTCWEVPSIDEIAELA